MRAGKKISYSIIIALVGIFLAGCAGQQARPTGGIKPVAITVASAASLKPVVTKIAAEFERRTGTKVNLSFGSSGLLARQIESGAPIDVFISADKEFVDQLSAQGLTSQTRPYARGFIVFYGADASDDLLSVKTISIADPNQAPYGRAAIEYLKKKNIWPRVKDRIVYADNVAQAYEFAKTGNTDAGVVALSLAKGTGADYALIDPESYKPLVKWLAIIKRTDNHKTSKSFTAFMRSSFAKKALVSAGFEPVR